MIRHEITADCTSQTTVYDYWNRVYRRKKLGGASVRTIEYYQHELNNFSRAFKALLAAEGERRREPQLADLNDGLLAAVMERRVRIDGRSNATANKIHKVITPIWRHAKRNGLVDRLPDVDQYPAPDRVRATPTPARFEEIVDACRNAPGCVGKIPAKLWWPALCLVDVNLGVRINALMSIRWADIDLENRRVLVRGEHQKHGADQWFELFPRTIEAIEPLLAWNHSLLFPWPFDRQEFQWQTLRRHYKRILKAAGLPHGPEQMFHAFRRYTATRITASDSIEAAQKYLGHSSVKVTRRYVDPLQGVSNRTASAAFPELQGPATPPRDPEPTPPPPLPSGGRASFLRVFHGDSVHGDSVAG